MSSRPNSGKVESGVATSVIGVGVVGLGFMGRTHIGAYRDANHAGFGNTLLAVSDPDPRRLTGMHSAGGNIMLDSGMSIFDPSRVRTSTKPEEVFALPAVDLVSICTPTDSHVSLTIAALEQGKHVLLEKPVATALADVRRLADAAKHADRVVMPAMCMRFWPGWQWLKERIAEGVLGKVRAAVFTRIGSPPGWSPEFYQDAERTGGALFDLHVHDVDFIVHCFGTPQSVRSAGDLNHMTTSYFFAEGGPLQVSAEGGWTAAGWPFRMRFTVEFEKAVADFDFGRPKPLMLAKDGHWREIELPTLSGYEGEVRHMLAAVSARKRGDRASISATLDDAVTVTGILEAERKSLQTRREASVG
jgi:predicted dehydrogenase